MKWLRWVLVATVSIVIAALFLFLIGLYEIIKAPHRPTELSARVSEKLISANGQLLSSIVAGDFFCVLGIGADPQIYAMREFKDYSNILEREDDPFFLRSDAYWHILAFTNRDKKFWIVPISIQQLEIAPQEYGPVCAPDFTVSARTIREGVSGRRRILDVR